MLWVRTYLKQLASALKLAHVKTLASQFNRCCSAVLYEKSAALSGRHFLPPVGCGI
jgi:hypothetical protein